MEKTKLINQAHVNPMPAPVFSRFQDVNTEPIIIPKIMAKIGLPTR